MHTHKMFYGTNSYQKETRTRPFEGERRERKEREGLVTQFLGREEPRYRFSCFWIKNGSSLLSENDFLPSLDIGCLHRGLCVLRPRARVQRADPVLEVVAAVPLQGAAAVRARGNCAEGKMYFEGKNAKPFFHFHTEKDSLLFFQ